MPINVVKIGGNVIDDETKKKDFLKLFSELKGDKILVHGGGKIATKIASDLGIKAQMVEGRRITDAPMRDIVTMVYGGLVNKDLVASLQALRCNALGLSGADAGLIIAQKRKVETIDYGYVGDIVGINGKFLLNLLQQKITPVISPLSFDPAFGILNTNADTMASEIAIHLAQDRLVNLIYCFEKPGVLSDPDDDNSVIKNINLKTFQKYKDDKVITDGMIPKLENAFQALQKGIKKVIICQANDAIEAIEKGNAGTQLVLGA